VEHRCGTRHPVDIGVYVRSRNGAVSSPGRLSDISVTGGFVNTVFPAQLLSYVAIQVLADELLAGELRAIEGQVIRRTSVGIGIEWNEYAPQVVRYSIARLVDCAPEVRSPASILGLHR